MVTFVSDDLSFVPHGSPELVYLSARPFVKIKVGRQRKIVFGVNVTKDFEGTGQFRAGWLK
jgi:hypothetical protein